MSKRNITDFFKPFGLPRPGKHPPPNGNSEEPRPSQRSRSTTPKATKHPIREQEHTSTEAKESPLILSQSPFLSSLPNSSPSPSPSETPLDQGHDTLTVPFQETASALSNVEDASDPHGITIYSSQRIIRNGEVIIKDSDDERSESDISLEDLHDLIAPRRPPVRSSSPPELESTSPPSPIATRSTVARHAKKGKRNSAFTIAADSLTPATNVPKYRFSLDALVKQSKNDEASRVSIQNAKLVLKNLDEQQTASTSAEAPRLDEDLLAAIIKDGDDDGAGGMERLMATMVRTEALHQDKHWSFFSQGQEIADVEPAGCPSVGDPYWQKLFGGPFLLKFNQVYV